MSEKNPAPPKESRQIPPHSDGEVSNPAPPAERCAKCGHDVERHEEAPTANQPYCWDCPPPECYHIAPAPLADGGKTVFDGYPLSRAEYVERIHEGGRGGYGIATHDVLMHHDAALRAEVERLRAENAELFGQTALERRRADNEKARAEKAERERDRWAEWARSSRCIYCGAVLPNPLDDSQEDADRIKREHVASCEKHPLRAAEARAEKLAAALREAGECLSKWDTEVTKARQIIARALAGGEEGR